MQFPLYAVLLLTLATQLPTSRSADYLVVAAELRDGGEVRGLLEETVLEFDALTGSGEPVRVRVEKPPEWSNKKWVCRIDWDADRSIFVVRNFSWTGELARIWNSILLSDLSGGSVLLDGDRIRSVRFGHFKDKQEVRNFLADGEGS